MKSTEMWWSNLSEDWKRIFAINYVFHYRFSQQMRDELLSVGVNPFKNYAYKLGREFKMLEVTETEIVKMQNMTMLYMADCKISDLLPATGSAKLEFIDCCFNAVGNLDALRNMHALHYLYFEKNALKNIDGISHCISARHIVLRENYLSDIRPLEPLKKLTFLDLSNNHISDVTPLGKLSNLVELQCSLNDITDASIINKLKNLEILDISSNKLSNVDFVFDLPKLKYLNVGLNPLEYGSYDWQKLKDRSVIVEK